MGRSGKRSAQARGQDIPARTSPPTALPRDVGIHQGIYAVHGGVSMLFNAHPLIRAYPQHRLQLPHVPIKARVRTRKIDRAALYRLYIVRRCALPRREALRLPFADGMRGDTASAVSNALPLHIVTQIIGKTNKAGIFVKPACPHNRKALDLAGIAKSGVHRR